MQIYLVFWQLLGQMEACEAPESLSVSTTHPPQSPLLEDSDISQHLHKTSQSPAVPSPQNDISLLTFSTRSVEIAEKTECLNVQVYCSKPDKKNLRCQVSKCQKTNLSFLRKVNISKRGFKKATQQKIEAGVAVVMLLAFVFIQFDIKYCPILSQSQQSTIT